MEQQIADEELPELAFGVSGQFLQGLELELEQLLLE